MQIHSPLRNSTSSSQNSLEAKKEQFANGLIVLNEANEPEEEEDTYDEVIQERFKQQDETGPKEPALVALKTTKIAVPKETAQRKAMKNRIKQLYGSSDQRD